MTNVIAHEVVERDRLGFRHGVPSDLVEIVRRSRARPRLVRHRVDHACDVQIELAPERHERRPGRRFVRLQVDPALLLVTMRDELIAERRTDETSVIRAADNRGGPSSKLDEPLNADFASPFGSPRKSGQYREVGY